MSENLSAEETATELDAVGVTVADNVVAKVEEGTGLPEADQRARWPSGRSIQPSCTSGQPACRGASGYSGVGWLLAAAVVLAVATASVVWLASPASPGPGDFDTNSTSQAASDVTEWPLRGNLRDDQKLLNRAVSYWNSPDAVMSIDPPYWTVRLPKMSSVQVRAAIVGDRTPGGVVWSITSNGHRERVTAA